MCNLPGGVRRAAAVYHPRHEDHRTLDAPRRHGPGRRSPASPGWAESTAGNAVPAGGDAPAIGRRRESRAGGALQRGDDGRAASSPDLFGIKSTGVSTDPVRKAADAFLAALTAEQRGTHRLRRGRRRVAEVDEPALLRAPGRELPGAVAGAARVGVRAAARRAQRARAEADARHHALNHTLGELNDNDFEQYGEWRYHLTVMGTPSATEPWGWQFDGHHADRQLLRARRPGGDDAVLRRLRAGDRARPASTRAPRSSRTSRTAAWRSSTRSTRRSAPRRSSRADKTRNNNLTEAWKDNVVVPHGRASWRRSCPTRSGSSCSI